jgi:hypothetical protein
MELFGTNNPKKRANITVEERSNGKKKERGCTVRLFRTKSLKKGAV